MDGISIIVTAYKTQNYIKECLDSIQAQTWFNTHDNYEILLGIDHCEETLNKVKEIMGRYKNLTVIYMDENYGTYITSNTLISISKYDWILRFDSDDIMKPDMVQSIFEFLEVERTTDIIRFYSKEFSNTFNVAKHPVLSHGQLCIRKSVFKNYGAFKAWICSADSELLARLKTEVKIKNLSKVTFFRRRHALSLTKMRKTDMNSPIRQKYWDYIKEKSKLNPIVETQLGNYKMVLADGFSDLVINASVGAPIIELPVKQEVKQEVKPVSKKVFLRSKHSYYGV